ncbi:MULTISPECIES: hypothetical protein [Rhodococcus erythropolis group]|uniref:hypothetical protein n=1 Tax=Rhodococcus erythropolis group TaxID=2840174 RepID=UPI001BEC706E|nr:MULTISPECIES: hypothetical protein [Rhodococcus erythropolis group]MBT2263399.1 hypothetical protein [Rhodococcus erythropolis]MBT2272214.1 hypothetical protein [Rhodococcus qingshengii]
MIFKSDAGRDPLRDAQRARAFEYLGRRWKARALLQVSELVEAGDLTQMEVGEALGISQPAVSKSLKKAKIEPCVPEGFSGSEPREIVALYVIGEISRDQMIDELSWWDCAYRGREFGLRGGGHSAADCVVEAAFRACGEGLIDEDACQAIERHRGREVCDCPQSPEADFRG